MTQIRIIIITVIQITSKHRFFIAKMKLKQCLEHFCTMWAVKHVMFQVHLGNSVKKRNEQGKQKKRTVKEC